MERKKKKPTFKSWPEVKRNRGAFLAWFTAQFGKTNHHSSTALLHEIKQTEAHLSALRTNYWLALTYEVRRDAALKGWCARDKS